MVQHQAGQSRRSRGGRGRRKGASSEKSYLSTEASFNEDFFESDDEMAVSRQVLTLLALLVQKCTYWRCAPATAREAYLRILALLVQKCKVQE
jgi:hypothetical protein